MTTRFDRRMRKALTREPVRVHENELGHVADHNRLERLIWNLERTVLKLSMALVGVCVAVVIHIVWGNG